MALVRWDPFKDFLSIQDEIGRVFRRAFGPGEEKSPLRWIGGGGWTPAVDIYETDKEVVAEAELPGLEAKDVDVTVDEDVITIKGERKFSSEVKEEDYHRVERRYGLFERTLPLPTSVKKDSINATFRDGLLKVTMPKEEKAKARKIKVKIDSGGKK